MGEPSRRVDALFERYGESHRHPTNKAIHWICVPLITWSVLALLWAASPAAAYALIGLSFVFYLTLSFALAMGMLAVAALMVAPLALGGAACFRWPPGCSSSRGSASSSATGSRAASHRSSRT